VAPDALREDGRTVLLVDDEESFRVRLARALTERGFEVWQAANVPAAIELIETETESPEYAVVDLKMPGPSGLHLVRRLHAIDPTTRIVVLTGYGSIATALDAVRSGAVHYLTKPTTIDDLLEAFQHDGQPALEPPEATIPSLDRVAWEHIERVLADCDGNITQAARLLGLHRRSLQRKLRKVPSSR